MTTGPGPAPSQGPARRVSGGAFCFRPSRPDRLPSTQRHVRAQLEPARRVAPRGRRRRRRGARRVEREAPRRRRRARVREARDARGEDARVRARRVLLPLPDERTPTSGRRRERRRGGGRRRETVVARVETSVRGARGGEDRSSGGPKSAHALADGAKDAEAKNAEAKNAEAKNASAIRRRRTTRRRRRRAATPAWVAPRTPTRSSPRRRSRTGPADPRRRPGRPRDGGGSPPALAAALRAFGAKIEGVPAGVRPPPRRTPRGLGEDASPDGARDGQGEDEARAVPVQPYRANTRSRSSRTRSRTRKRRTDGRDRGAEGYRRALADGPSAAGGDVFPRIPTKNRTRWKRRRRRRLFTFDGRRGSRLSRRFRARGSLVDRFALATVPGLLDKMDAPRAAPGRALGVRVDTALAALFLPNAMPRAWSTTWRGEAMDRWCPRDGIITPRSRRTRNTSSASWRRFGAGRDAVPTPELMAPLEGAPLLPRTTRRARPAHAHGGDAREGGRRARPGRWRRSACDGCGGGPRRRARPALA